MARRAPGPGADAGPGLREQLRQDYSERVRRFDGWGSPRFSATGNAERVLSDLAAGRPVVLPASELYGYRLDEVRAGRPGWFRVEVDGAVTEVVPRRDPRDPMSINGWNEVP